MKIYLIGYPGSQKIVPVSKYLTSKYLGYFEEIIYLNYTGPLEKWSAWLADYFKKLTDKHIIFALDDYLVSGFNQQAFETIFLGLSPCVKLCKSTPAEDEEYPVTTQYTVWKREFLIWLLEQTTDPWNFETKGSALFKTTDQRAETIYCIDYDVHSALSKRWSGINFGGLNEEDIKEIKKLT